MVFPEILALNLLIANHVIFFSPSQPSLPLGQPLGHSGCSQGLACSRSSATREMSTQSLVHPVKQSASSAHYKVNHSCHCLGLLPASFHLLDTERRLPAPKLHMLEPRASLCVHMLGHYGPMSSMTTFNKTSPNRGEGNSWGVVTAQW